MRVETSPDDFHGMAVAQGILTARGGATSHAAVVARQIGKPCVAGCAELVVDYAHQDGPQHGLRARASARATGSASTAPRVRSSSSRCRPWPPASRTSPSCSRSSAGPTRSAGSRSGPTPTSPRRPPRPCGYGAQGIGLCRTEHMFREGDRLEIVRGAILVANQATRAKAKVAAGETLTADEADAVATFDGAMAKLEVLQQGDFEGILAAMDGLPVVIRLIDPPLHEFLPNLEEQLVKVTKAGDAATEEDKELLATIKSMHEQNPMLGLRGCRLGLMIPDFVKIQTRAILNAAVAVKRAGKHPHAGDHDPAGRAT